MQIDRILDKASRLGMSIDTNLSNEENINIIASSLGIDSDDFNRIENELDYRLAIGNYGNFDKYIPNDGKDYYKNKQELDKNVEDAKAERNKDTKEVPNKDKKSEGSDKPETQTVRKNKFDKLKDGHVFRKLNARKNQVQNIINDAKSKLYQATPPAPELKNKAKEPVNNVKDNIKNKVKEKGKEAAKKTGHVFLNFIKKNPYVLVIIGIIIFVLFITIIIGGAVMSSCTIEYEYLSLKETEFTKEQFVNKFTNYFSKDDIGWHNCTNYFRDYGLEEIASEFYDVSIENEINPEVTVARAIAEGCSPSANNESTPAELRYDGVAVTDWKKAYNLWGIRCYHGSIGDCATYNSLEEGISYFSTLVRPYDTARDMMARYISEDTADRHAEAMTSIRDTIFYDGNSTLSSKKICKNNSKIFSSEYPIDPDDELYSDAKLLYGISFEEVLKSNGMEVEDFDKYLLRNIEKAGVGSRAGVVAAATTLIGSMAEMGYKMNYDWGGKYYNIGANPKWGSKFSGFCNHYAEQFGEEKKSICTNNYMWRGFDCSGFVNWALINGMQDATITRQSTTYVGGISLDRNNAVCKPGGVLVNDGHIMLVIGSDVDKKKYIVAEQTGGRVDTNFGGLAIRYKDFNESTYVCRNLEEMYGD